MKEHTNCLGRMEGELVGDVSQFVGKDLAFAVHLRAHTKAFDTNS